MRILCAIDSFKGSLSSLEAGLAAKEGILNFNKNYQVDVLPLGDGGEGTMEALTIALKGKFINKKVQGPLKNKVNATYGYVPNKKLAIIEMSQSSGITLLKRSELNPLFTTTYGFGELILDALNKGTKHFILAIGGSATNDGGVGMLMALGYRFLDKNNKSIKLGAIGLKDLKKIDNKHIDKRLKNIDITVASDVNNPLCGCNGCSAIFGPQKGATKLMIKQMDEWINHYAALTKKTFNKDCINAHGAGAAGGLGYALMAYLNAKLVPGIDLVLKTEKFEEQVKKVNLVITGEGRLDSQTCMGKAPSGVAHLAKKYHKPVIAIAGCISEDARINNKKGIDAYLSILQKPVSLDEAVNKKNAKENMVKTAEQIIRLYALNK